MCPVSVLFKAFAVIPPDLLACKSPLYEGKIVNHPPLWYCGQVWQSKSTLLGKKRTWHTITKIVLNTEIKKQPHHTNYYQLHILLGCSLVYFTITNQHTFKCKRFGPFPLKALSN